jgi:DNA polymerase beta
MYLDEYGLWRWHSSEEAMLESQSHPQPNADAAKAQNDGCAGYWELVEGESEDRILDELELGAIAPQRRNFRFLTSKKRILARSGTVNLSEAELEELAVAEEDGEGRER